MFKKIAYSVVFGAMLAGLAACSAEPDYENGAITQGEKCSFLQSVLNASVIAREAGTFEIKLVRTNSQGSLSVPLTISPIMKKVNDEYVIDTNYLFEGPEVSTTAEFTDGNNTTSITISVPAGLPPTMWGGVITMNKDVVSASGNQSCQFVVKVEYDWLPIGEGTFADTFAGMDRDNPFTVEIQKADGFDRWRIIEPYSAYYDDEDCEIYSWPDGWDGNAANAPEFVEFWNQSDGYICWDVYNSGVTFEGAALYSFPANYIGYVEKKWYDMTGWGVVMDLNVWTDSKHAELAPVYQGPDCKFWWPQCSVELPPYSPSVFITLP